MRIGGETSALSPSGRPGDGKALRTVAKEFEGLLMAEVMKAMRQTVPKSPLSSGIGQEVFTGMLDQELSGAMSKGSGLGLADLLVVQLGGEPATVALPAEPEVARVLAQGEWRAPLAGNRGPVSAEQSFGAYRPGDRPAACSAGHCGVDLGRPEGTPVLAAADGVITKVGHDPDSSTGLWVEISHRNGRITSRYLHLSKITDDLAPGRRVAVGEKLGEVGNTGFTSHGNHLHFELLHQSRYGMTRWVDPSPYLLAWSEKPGPQTAETPQKALESAQESAAAVDVDLNDNDHPTPCDDGANSREGP
jgi:peptidoglycan LD-endopeptidase LytH